MDAISKSTPVALLGLGIIGSGIANHLRKNGWNILVWNRTPKHDLPNDFTTAREAAEKTRILCLYLKDREACRTIINDIQPVLGPGHIIINHSTIDVPTAKEIAEICTASGADYWEAPFTGSRIPASQGELVYYISGPSEKWPVAAPLLEASSKAIFHFGDNIGNAMTVKLVTNLISCITVQALSEALSIVKAQGMSAQNLLDALSLNVCASLLAANKIPAMDRRDFSTNFSLDNMRKDSVYVRELAQSERLSTPAIDLVSHLMAKLCDQGYAEEDFSALIRHSSSQA